MIYIYILLTIITIGVLLASEAGQKLLLLLGWLVAIGGILYLGFWAVIFMIGLFSDESLRETMGEKIAVVGFWILVYWGGYTIYKKYQRGEITQQSIKQAIKNRAKDSWLGIHNASKGVKVAMIFVILSFSFIVFTIVMLSFKK